MNQDTPAIPEGLEVRSYFVRGRNALLARADFGDLYVDYYLHQGQHGYQHAPQHDEQLKEALAALTLHCASRPRTEGAAWTIHFEDPPLNLFVTGNNQQGTVVGQLFTENIREKGHNLFISDAVTSGGQPRRSVVDFTTKDVFGAVEHFYHQSEQRPARYFRLGPEDFVMLTAQPNCDVEWLASLDDATVAKLDETETLSLLETRHYRWECGCTEERMFAVLAPVMRMDPEGLFEGDDVLRMSCPRCGARHLISREALEAYVANSH